MAELLACLKFDLTFLLLLRSAPLSSMDFCRNVLIDLVRVDQTFLPHNTMRGGRRLNVQPRNEMEETREIEKR